MNDPLRAHDGPVTAAVAGAPPDGTATIVSGGRDGTVRVWRRADGASIVPPLDLPESVRAVAVHGLVIVVAAGADIAVHHPALPERMR
jgi:WD40 repeat protein